MSCPLVTIIIPVKNGGRYLKSAIESVRRTGYQPREIIVVDGKSEDDSRMIAKSFNEVRLVEQSGRGLSAAWNSGINQARGELIAFLDSDDFWSPNKLHLQVPLLRRHAEIQYAIGRVEFFLEPGCSIPVGFRSTLLEDDHVGQIPGTLIARRSLFESIGGFDPNLALAGDVDWFARAKDNQIPMALLDEVVLYKRVHDRNLSSNARANTRELLEILRRSVGRQRESVK